MNKIPLLSGEPTDRSIIKPLSKAKNRLILGKLDLDRLPKRVILCFFKDFYRLVEELYNPHIYRYHDDFPIYIFTFEGKEIAFLYPTIGSYASTILEEVIALGGKEIIAIGGVGTTWEGIVRGDLILPDKAIRDEGVSYQYEKPSTFSYPGEKLRDRIKVSIQNRKLPFVEGATWTVSSVYRETENKLRQFLDLGAVCVDMEAASFYSIAKFREVELASLFIAGDNIAGNKWGSQKSPGKMDSIRAGREKLLQIALDALGN